MLFRSNGAPPTNAPLVTLVTNGALAGGAPLVVLQKKIVVAYGVSGAPLLVKTSNGALRPGAPLVFLEKRKEKNLLVVAQHGCGAPLV